jgi:hypothetical protein
MKKRATTKGESPSRLIDARIRELDDWRGKTLSHVRALIKQADPEVVEEWVVTGAGCPFDKENKNEQRRAGGGSWPLRTFS